MQSNHRWTWGLLVPVLLSSASLSAATNVVVRMKVPVLSICGNSGKGRCDNIRLVYERDGSAEPLRISISDDMPLGTGDASRAAVWLAAATAAVARNDPITGVQLNVQFSGFTDGPSMGGVMCLAILSALDGRKLPEDFAMTGTIMPDGTIGLVGGIAQKVRAAVRAGKRRICIPLFSRFEEQAEKVGGGIVDLFRMGDELGVEVRPVANIAEAYSYAYGVAAPTVFCGDAREVLPLDPKLEDVLIGQYREFKKELEAWRTGPKKDVPKEYGLDEFFADDFYGEDYEKMFLSGFLASATDTQAKQIAAWKALEPYGEFLDSVRKECPASVKTNGFTKVERKAFVEIVKLLVRDSEDRINNSDTAICEHTGVFTPDEDGLPDVSSQFERQNPFIADGTGKLLGLEEISPTVVKVEAAGNCEDDDADVLLVGWYRLEMLKRFLRYWTQMRVMDEAKLRVPAARKLPPLKAGAHVEQASAVFHSAWEAVEKSLVAGTVASIAEKNNASRDRVLLSLSMSDAELATYLFDRGSLRRSHAALKPDFDGVLSNRNYHAAAVLYADARVLASACAQLVKYGPEAGLRRSEGEPAYSNMAFVNYLIRSARQRALRTMAECKRRGIPYPGPQMAFCRAELIHGTKGTDPVDSVLRRYWESALGAKALLMAFGR